MNIFIDIQLLTALSQRSASTKFLSPPRLQVFVSLGAVMTVLPIFLSGCIRARTKKVEIELPPFSRLFALMGHLIIPFVLCAMHPAPWPLVLKKTTLDLRIFSLLFVFGKPGSIRNSPQQCSDGVAVGWETWTAMVKWLKCMFENW